MGKKKTRDQAYRAAALEAALDAMAKAGRVSGAERIELDPDNVLRYAKFILGKKKRSRTIGRAYVDILPRKREPDATSGQPVGEDPGDRGVLTQWAEAIRQQEAAREAALEGEKLEEKVDEDEGKDGTRGDDGSPFWNARPEVRTVTLTPASSPVDKRVAEETMGLIPGALDEELTITNEGTFLPDGSPAEKARAEEFASLNDYRGERRDLSAEWAPQRHAPGTSEKAPDAVVLQGAAVGCPECSAEADRRKGRDARLMAGRSKLADRRVHGPLRRSGPLDEDELLAVAGSELYPPYDEEPSRELKIRNRKGEVRTHTTDGWTMTPDNPWRLGHAWTSSEMVRRGPWHVI